MLDLRKAPERGTIYAVLRDRIEFKTYESLEEITDIVNAENLLELHLFDKKKEYRIIQTRKKGVLEAVIDEDTKADDIYEEEIYVLGSEKDVDKADELSRKVAVVNYITYNEDDMIIIRNYRLKEVE